jgi:hypothetical protein
MTIPRAWANKSPAAFAFATAISSSLFVALSSGASIAAAVWAERPIAQVQSGIADDRAHSPILSRPRNGRNWS